VSTCNNNDDKAQLLINTNNVIFNGCCGNINVVGLLQLFNLSLALIWLHLSYSGSDLPLPASLWDLRFFFFFFLLLFFSGSVE